MSVPQNFRSAFNGFNREDVVKYIEYLNARHTAEVNQLTSESEFLQGKLNALEDAPSMKASLEQAEAERDALKEQVSRLQAQIEQLEQDLEEALTAAPAAAAPQPQRTVSASYNMEAELEYYRRAERIERQARDRAEQVYRVTNGALADATVQVEEAAQSIGELADRVSEQLALLQNAVAGSKQTLRSAAATMYAVRPSDEGME